MTEIKTIFISIIVAVLVVLGGIWILRKGPDHTSSRRFLLYLLVIGVLLMPVVFFIEQISPTNRIPMLTAPIVIGVLALILVNLKLLAQLKPSEKLLVTLLGLILLGLLIASVWIQPYGITQIILLGTLVLAIIWVLVGKFDALGINLSLVALILLTLFNSDFLENLSTLPEWLRIVISLLMFSLPGLVVALVAVWITSVPKVFSNRDETEGNGTLAFWLPVVLRIGLAATLLGYLAYTTFWASIWDHTSDGLGGIMFAMWASLAAIAAGMLMGITATGWRKLTGLLFALVVPALMFSAFWLGWDVSYHAITEGRASRIQGSIESFYVDNGHYPTDLGELIPAHLLWIPKPVILRGEGWCYQGGQNYYRLGAFYREYFGTPLSLREYASAGSLPETGWVCEQQLATMKARYDPPPFYEMEAARPTAEPLPTSVVPFQRASLQPLLSGQFIIPESWSLDGSYLVFSQLETIDRQPAMVLSFLDSRTGEICWVENRYPPESVLHEKYVWLPDGRLLFISEDGGINLLQPCQPGTEDISTRFPERFTQVAASDQKGSRILLKNQDSFWIMDGNSLDVWPVPEVTPNPYELHWDQYAWSPDGKRLVISRLNGRDRKAGSTLYLINVETGGVLESQSLEYASDQSAPGVEWLTNEELLLQSSDILVIVNYSSEPPLIVDVREDLFALDFDYPNDIASWTSIVDPTRDSYYLAVRLNESKDKGLYLYRSNSGDVQSYHPTTNNMLLFFPGGAWTELSSMSFGIPEQDEFELVWVDMPVQTSQYIVVQGHIPRNYPHLFPKFLTQSSQMIFRSSQGISLISIPEGETLKFWEFPNGAGNLDITLRVSPNEDTLVAIADREELFLIPLRL